MSAATPVQAQEDYVSDWINYALYADDNHAVVTGVKNEEIRQADIPASITPEGSGRTYAVTEIGDRAFHACRSLTSLTIPGSVTSIGNGAFKHCVGLTSVTIPGSVTSIGDGAFSDCRGLTSIEVASGNPSYSSSDGVLFDKARTTLVTYPMGKQGSSYTIPTGVTSIGEGAFFWCSGLTSVTIPDGVTSIGDDAFYLCSGLTSVTIPGSVTSIGYFVFGGCSGLENIYCMAQTPPSIEDNTFERYSVTLHVPTGSKAAYASAEYWKNFTNIVEDIELAIGHLAAGPSVAYHAGILSLPNDSLSDVFVYTANGRLVQTWRAVAGGDYDLSPLAQGIYLIKVQTERGMQTCKVVL